MVQSSQGRVSRELPAWGSFSNVPEELLRWEGALSCGPGNSGNLRRWESFLYHQVCPGDVGMALSGPGRRRVLGVPLGCGITTYTLNSGAVQQVSEVPLGHLGAPRPVVTPQM